MTKLAESALSKRLRDLEQGKTPNDDAWLCRLATAVGLKPREMPGAHGATLTRTRANGPASASAVCQTSCSLAKGSRAVSFS